jgi:diguanylate cyclase (GGDEF)-like protein/PAS domain S-box-containing protein
MLYRRWVAEQGGVYVPVTEHTPPNPHLSVPNRDVTTTSGVSLTLINPAYMTRQVNEIGKGLPSGKGHLTSLKPIRPENLPDRWETESLKAFEKGSKEVSSVVLLNGEEYMRLMRPFTVEKGCMKCHAHQGYQVGQVRGGISVSIALEPLMTIYRSSVARIAWAHGLLWIFGLAGIGLGVLGLTRQIGQRDQVRDALEKERERLSMLSENAPFGLVMIDKDGRFTYVNPKFREFFGYDPEEIGEGKTWFRLAYPDPEYRHKVIEAWLKDKMDKGTHQKRARIFSVVCKDGSRKTVNFISVQLVSGETVMSCEDITEAVRAEKALREQYQFLQKLIDTMPAPIFYKDRAGIYRGCNRAYTDHVGLSREAIVGKTVYEVHPPQQADIYFHADEELFRNPGAQTYETTIRYADGTLHNVVYSKATYTDTEGNVDGLIGVILDITDRKRMEERLERMAVLDELTGLYNRRGFLTLAGQQIKLAERTREGMVLFFIDLDGMKWINDTFGHQKGDQALVEVSNALRRTFRESDIMGRIGGDEYAVLALHASAENGRALRGRLDAILKDFNLPGNLPYTLAVSVGMVYCDPEQPLNLDELIVQADRNMYEDKKMKGVQRKSEP